MFNLHREWGSPKVSVRVVVTDYGRISWNNKNVLSSNQQNEISSSLKQRQFWS